MAVSAGPKIVKDGLVLCLDAGNSESYPGTGTTWFDLVGNTNGTLVNGVTYNTSSRVFSINQTSSDQYIDIPINLTNVNHTIIAASRWTSADGRGRVVTSANNNWFMGYYGFSLYVDAYYAEGWVSLVNPGTADTNWRIHAAIGDVSADSWAIYSNATLKAGPNNQGASGPNGIRIGASGIYGEYSRCEIGFLLAYNRALSQEEIEQNFNSLRGRYGI